MPAAPVFLSVVSGAEEHDEKARVKRTEYVIYEYEKYKLV